MIREQRRKKLASRIEWCVLTKSNGALARARSIQNFQQATGLFIPSVNSFGISIVLIHGAILKSFNMVIAQIVRIFLMHINSS